jgi:formate dehydrogenase iron-sulfur subunit
MTAVDRFAQKHEVAEFPLQQKFYRDLLPLSRPQLGEQYAFEVNLDECTGCKACVAACHSLNGLEDDESWRSVGLLVGDKTVQPFQQTVTTACHHCVDPGCLHGCPVLAYEKDEVTGIVRHLDDQCIGCQYCVLKCPYEVPQYSHRLGIVRKCDMCTSRLSAGEAPACVQSCPSEAIRITVVNKIEVTREYIRNESFLPASPDPRHTIPSTRYVSSRGLPSALSAGDESNIQPAAAHWPLVLMLVMTQASIGGVISAFIASLGGAQTPFSLVLASAVFGISGIAASIMHLGRPLHAWRALLGVRRSWLSREILTFGAYASSLLLLLVAEVRPIPFLKWPGLMMAAVAGAAALCASIMVYADTPREFWRFRRTAPRFLGTALLLGTGLWLSFSPSDYQLYALICAVAAGKFALELEIFRHLSPGSSEALRRSAILQSQRLRLWSVLRFATLLIGGALLAQWGFVRGGGQALAIISFALLAVSEVLERTLFFRSVAQPKMPGGLS